MKPLTVKTLLLSAVLVTPILVISSPSLAASAAVTQILSEYQQLGAGDFSAPAGAELWNRNSDGRRCSSCHTEDPSALGHHQKTRKPIEPLAPSANAKRLTEVKTIKKWLLRNCKWTLGRECTPQEKGDFLTWLSQQ